MRCRLCGADSVEQHFDFGRQPIAHRLTATPGSGEQHPFRVGFCEACGFQQLTDMIPPAVLYQDYFTMSAWKPQPHAERIIDVAEAMFGITTDTAVLEVGCNDGSFLEILRARGYANLTGIEPCADSCAAAQARGFTVDKAFFGPGSAHKADLIVCRQVLEHIPDLHAFLDAARECLTPTGGIVIEVPDHAMNYETLDYTFWEEHVNYFTINTLRTLLALAGFDIVHTETVLFSGKAMIVYAKPSQRVAKPTCRNRDREAAYAYRDAYPAFQESAYWYVVDGPVTPTGAVVLYGAGARSTNFCNLLGLSGFIDAVIDDQPEKQGLYLPGFKVPITAHTDGILDGKLVLLGVNTENETKVIRKRGITCYASVLPPSPHLPPFWRAAIA